ncbi:MAG: aminotransferase class I/II-fold pyridoxal phosphate-dependent enzyme [Alphaproteobacteria bacterium]|nr:aminotransferase class I/II-fold pyridoxal phosphate-dependent enzyme [Alphaproteobacteria bacterium]MBL6953966.1 aminotransferase class I/II-fold pyridoxal phosphate-dependent enzyme [Alphaproteobacteria bacterium]
MSRFKASPSQIASARVRDLQAEGRDIIKLTAGEPDFPAPEHAKQAVIALMERNEIQYTPVNGTLPMRKAVQAKFKRDNGLDYELDQIAVGSGSKQVLFNALMATVSAGDEVIIPGPYWASYPDMVKLAGGTPVFVLAGQNEKFKMRAEALEAAITPQTKWLMFCSPSNPTGAAYSHAELRALADVLLRHPGVHVLTDDVYEHLIFDGRAFATLAQVEPKLFDRTVTVNSVSKAYSMTGFRCGYAGGPKDIIAKMANMQSQSTAGVSAVGQAAAVAALNGPQELLAARAANLQHRRDMLFEKLNAAAGLSCDLPDGAMYIFCSCAGTIGKRAPDGRVIETDTDFTMYLLDAVGVAVVQGEAYGLSPYFRASFVAPEADLIRGGDLIQQACAALT